MRKVCLGILLASLMAFNSYTAVLDKPIETQINHVEGRQNTSLESNFTQLDQEIQKGDIIVSQLSANMHFEVAKLCLKNKNLGDTIHLRDVRL